MATTTTDSQPQVRMIDLAQISHDANIRELAVEDVEALAGSIALLGQITPAIVRPDGEGYMLVAGFHRYAAARQLGLSEIIYELRDGDTENADRAVENIARKQLDPHEPGGIALDASLDRSDDAIASEFGRSRASRLVC